MRLLVAPAIQRDIAQTLNRANFKVNLKTPALKDPSVWQITRDESVDIVSQDYLWADLEIISPAIEST